MTKLSYTTDLATLSAGSIVLAALTSHFLTEGASGLDHLLNGRHEHLVQAVLGASLVLWPIVRRLIAPLFHPADPVEFGDLTHSLRKIGLSHRVLAVNLYLGEKADDAWKMNFRTQQDLWDWLGEAFQDADLRAQMHPSVAQRAENAGRHVGVLRRRSVAG